MSLSPSSVAFAQVCAQLVMAVQSGNASEANVESLVTGLIRGLKRKGWDDSQAVLEKFQNKTYIVRAFAANGIALPDDGKPHNDHSEIY